MPLLPDRAENGGFPPRSIIVDRVGLVRVANSSSPVASSRVEDAKRGEKQGDNRDGNKLSRAS